MNSEALGKHNMKKKIAVELDTILFCIKEELALTKAKRVLKKELVRMKRVLRKLNPKLTDKKAKFYVSNIIKPFIKKKILEIL